mgnify:FL=1
MNESSANPSALVIGRQNHTCIKQKDRITTATEIVGKKFSVLKSTTPEPGEKEQVDSLFNNMNQNAGNENLFKPRPSVTRKISTTENTKEPVLSYGSEDEEIYDEEDEYTIISTKPRKTISKTDLSDDSPLTTEEESQIKGKDMTSPDLLTSQGPRISIMNWLKGEKLTIGTNNMDYLSKSTKFLDEYLNRNSMI